MPLACAAPSSQKNTPTTGPNRPPADRTPQEAAKGPNLIPIPTRLPRPRRPRPVRRTTGWYRAGQAPRPRPLAHSHLPLRPRASRPHPRVVTRPVRGPRLLPPRPPNGAPLRPRLRPQVGPATPRVARPPSVPFPRPRPVSERLLRPPDRPRRRRARGLRPPADVPRGRLAPPGRLRPRPLLVPRRARRRDAPFRPLRVRQQAARFRPLRACVASLLGDPAAAQVGPVPAKAARVARVARVEVSPRPVRADPRARAVPGRDPVEDPAVDLSDVAGRPRAAEDPVAVAHLLVAAASRGAGDVLPSVLAAVAAGATSKSSSQPS